ncbi:hypothetical protein [Peribacillus deserti]|uniref:Lysine transporter LysE n=1 Tax=Peribacillus deserti TaxID=673318 RepID=A0A2N5M5X7_9BACI|nr:hypothetical protein [Peribacillus deserti]PLT29759.1 hypothetical protein CUU66_11260 [Peribacillus deserti]
MDLFNYDNQLIVASLLGAFHGTNPAMGWLFAVFLAVQKGERRVLLYSLVPIAFGQLLGDSLTVGLQTFARFQFPLKTVHIVISILILLYGFYRLFRYYRHFKWSGGLNVGYGQLVLWSFLASSTHGSGLLFAPFILNAAEITDIIPLWFLHELSMLTTMTVIAMIVYHFGIVSFRRFIVNFELAWAVLLIGVGLFLLLMNSSVPGHVHMHGGELF